MVNLAGQIVHWKPFPSPCSDSLCDFREYLDLNKGNLLKGIIIWLVAALSVVQSPVSPYSLRQQVLVATFLYFNLKGEPKKKIF